MGNEDNGGLEKVSMTIVQRMGAQPLLTFPFFFKFGELYRSASKAWP